MLQCLRQASSGLPSVSLRATRTFQTAAVLRDEAQAQQAEAKKEPFYKNPDPELVSSPRLEKKLLKAGIRPIGSRRRRAALQTCPNIPFELLPYQCFQEARKIIQADREEKLKEIERQKQRIERLQALSDEEAGGANVKRSRLGGMQKHLHRLQIMADINDPLIKKTFEDGKGDMNQPIYHHLAEEKWKSYAQKIIKQRITQMKVIPDVLPHCEPSVDVRLYFDGDAIAPGEFVDSKVSLTTPKLTIQSFDAGEKYVTIAVIDPDVPNVEKNGFDYRCHYLAVNVPISPTNTKVDLAALSNESQVVLPWLPPTAQKGSPYHRLSLFVLEQEKPLDFAAVKGKGYVRDDLRLRTLQSRYHLKPIGAHLFRTRWDENMDEVMKQLGVEGWDMELRRKRVEPLPYKRRDTRRMRG